MNENNNEAPFNLDEINSAWSDLLAQLVVSRLTIKKQVVQLQTENNQLVVENENLRQQLKQTELNVIAAQGKSIIDSTS